MEIRPLGIAGALLITPRQFPDDRGVFLESFRQDHLAEHTGHAMSVAQTNISVSAQGVLRGIHFADVPPGQAKYVTVLHGAILDVAVDLRRGSPTFGQWEGVRLDVVARQALYLAEGLGHAFMALEEGTTVYYLCSTRYSPVAEHAVNPLDPQLAIAWPTDLTPILSPKDAAAPSLAEAIRSDLLPTWAGPVTREARGSGRLRAPGTRR